MNEEEGGDGPLPTVTPPSGTHPHAQMDAIGWLVFLGLLFLLLPVPLVVRFISRASDALSPT